jgi:uncharacterized membrane protein YjjP (DUF1212 family)
MKSKSKNYKKMTKEEILSRSIIENKGEDERDKKVNLIASDNSNLLIICVFVLLAIIASIQEFICGKAFADYKIFVLAFLIGYIGHYLTKYYYYRNLKFLFYSIVFIIISICTLIGIIVGA